MVGAPGGLLPWTGGQRGQPVPRPRSGRAWRAGWGQGATLAGPGGPAPRALRGAPPGAPAGPAPSRAGLAGPGAARGEDARSVEQLRPLAAAPGRVPTARPRPQRRPAGRPPGRLRSGAARAPGEAARTGDEQKKKKTWRTWREREPGGGRSSSAWIRGAASPPRKRGRFTRARAERGSGGGAGRAPRGGRAGGPGSPLA